VRTNIDVDDQLLSAARELLGTKTKRDTVHAALPDVVERRRRLALLELRGEVRWDGDLALAAALYRTARRAGVTIRRTLDCLIAVPCIRTGSPLLHADRDLDRLASCTPLRILA
jgi:Arc/MetJ family transcription regulator